MCIARLQNNSCPYCERSCYQICQIHVGFQQFSTIVSSPVETECIRKLSESCQNLIKNFFDFHRYRAQ